MLCAPLERHIKYLISDNDFGSTLSIFTLKLQWRASNKLGLICYWWCEGHARQEHLCGNQADSKVPRQSMTSRCSWRRSIISTVSPKRIYGELLEAAQAVASQVLSFCRVLSTRWVASIFRSVKAVWRSYCMEHWTDTLKILQKTKQETAKRGRLKEAWHIVCKARTFCVTSDSCMMYCLNSQTCLSNSRPIQSHFWRQTSFQSAPSESWHHSKTLLGRNQTRLCKHRPWDVIDQLPRSQMQGSHQSMQSNSSKIGLTTWRSASHLKVNCVVTSVFWTATLGHQDLAYGLVSYKWQDCAGGSVLVKSKLLRDVMVWEISLSTQTESLKVENHSYDACRPSHAALLNVKGVSDFIKSFWAKEVCQNTAGKSSLCHTGKENIDTEEAWVQTHLESFVDDRPYTPF